MYLQSWALNVPGAAGGRGRRRGSREKVGRRSYYVIGFEMLRVTGLVILGCDVW
jgi:hypothetical protein